MIKISFIIPVYNTEVDLIERCIESILSTQYSAVEIIIIDDGSNRDCAMYLDGIAKLHTVCIVYHTRNRGVSAARNYGVKVSSGDYIVFVDADDLISPRMLSDGLPVLELHKPDILYGLVKFEKRHLSIFPSEMSMQVSPILITDDLKCILLQQLISLGQPIFSRSGYGYLSRGPVARFVSRAIAIQIPFGTNLRLGEDEIWNILIAKCATKIMFFPAVWYYYVHNINSASVQYRDNIEEEERRRLIILKRIIGRDEKYGQVLLSKTLQCIAELLRQKYANKKYPFSLKCATENFQKEISKPEYSFFDKKKYIRKLSYKDRLKFILFKKFKYVVLLMRVGYMFYKKK